MDEKIKTFSSPYKLGQLITSDQAMGLAIEVAKLGAPYVSPNPLVGCVVVNERHEYLTFGFHHKYGTSHAEIDALKKLSSAEIIDSTFYVTLEPCAHEGKTPSCAKTLAKLALKKVVYGLVDPNPLVSGQGAAILSNAGIKTEEYDGELKSDLLDLCEVFLKNFKEKKIFIAAKVASSLDGQIALKSGESKWITGEQSRTYVHELRSYYDAIVVGRNTVQTDDPSLTIRHPEISKETKIIILDPDAKIIKDIASGSSYKFLQSHPSENIFFAVKKRSPDSKVTQIEFSNLIDLTERIWQLGIRSIFVEGGAATYSSFLTAHLIDRLYLFIAPSVIGSKNGISWTSEFGITTLNEKPLLKNIRFISMGIDLLVTGRMNTVI